MPEWIDTETGAPPTDREVQQLISAERGYPESGQRRRWYRPDADVTVLTVDETGLKLSRDDGTTAPAPPIVVGSPAGGDLTGAYPDPRLSPEIIDALVPPGAIWAYGGAAAPAGWLLCNGQAVSRTTYAKLFAVIGATYGAGDGSTTFTLPDLVGRMVLGESGAHARGQTGGSETAAGPPHTHPGAHHHGLNSHTHTLNNHRHGLNGHTHGLSHTHPGTHSHGLNGHAHSVYLDHDHEVVASGKRNNDSVGAFGFAEPAASSGTADHHHNVDLAPLTGLFVGSSDPTPATSEADANAPAASPTASGAPSPTTDTASPGVPSVPTTDTSIPTPIVDTADTDSHPDAVYPNTIPTLPPFGVARYIIRAGA